MILALALASSLGWIGGPAGEPSIHPERLFVKPLASAAPSAIDAALDREHARTLKELPQIGWRIIVTERGRLLATRGALQASGLFEHVDHDHASRLAHVPNDPYWYGMWHMTQIGADLAWDAERGDTNIRVAIIDTGLETSHPDLAANVWTNPGEIPGNGVDDDGNGYADDVHGWDFAYLDGVPDDVYGHGTACAGIVAAAQDNFLGVTGVAPGCEIAGLKASIDIGYLYDSAVVPALLYAADMDFDVASMSFFGDQVTSAQKDAIEYCWASGLLPVAAAGNSAHVLPYYPAAFDHVLAVGATHGGDGKSWFSDHGTWVDVAAPGEGLSTTTVGGSYTTGFGGTSGACPHVAGLAALLFSANPAATNADVRAAIEDACVLLDEPPFGKWSLYGRIDCDEAVDRILGLSTGSVAPRLTYVAPCGGSIVPSSRGANGASLPELVIEGVGLEQPNVVRVLRDGVALPLSSQERSRVTARVSNLRGTRTLEVNGQSVGSIRWDAAPGWVYAPSDASTTNPWLLSGGFLELYRDDGASMTCAQQGDGTVYVALCVRKIRPADPSAMVLEFTRSYTDAVGATEYVQLYDWTTWSFPYGSFETVSTRAITSGAVESFEVALPGDPARFIDIDGTVYVQIVTTGTGANGALAADGVRLRVR